MTYKDQFIKRLEEIGLQQGVDFSLTNGKKEYIFFLDVTENKDGIKTYAALGVVAHFKNRNWIVWYNYMYIMKNHIYITFNDGSEPTE